MTRNSSSGLHLKLCYDSEIINDGERVEIIRRHQGVYRNGIYVPSELSDVFVIKASIQPASGDQVLQVPENDRDKEILSIWSPTALLKNDILKRNGCEFEIKQVKAWGSYSESVAVKIDVV